MVLPRPSDLTSPLLDSGQPNCNATAPGTSLEGSPRRPPPALPPLAPWGGRPVAALGAANIADVLASQQAAGMPMRQQRLEGLPSERVPAASSTAVPRQQRSEGWIVPKVLPRPGIDTTSHLTAEWCNMDRMPQELPGHEHQAFAIDTPRLAGGEAKSSSIEVAYQAGFPEHIFSDFRFVREGRIVTEFEYDAGDGGANSAETVFIGTSASSSKSSGKAPRGDDGYAQVLSSVGFSFDLASVMLRTGIASAALFSNAAVLLVVSSTTPAARTMKYILGVAFAVSATVQLSLGNRLVRRDLPAGCGSAEAVSNDLDSKGSLLVWVSHMLFVIVGVPRHVKNIISEIHPLREHSGEFGMAALRDGHHEVFITQHGSACEYLVNDGRGQEQMIPVQLCAALLTTICKFILALLEPGFSTAFLILSALPSATSIVRDALCFRQLHSEREKFRKLLLRRHGSANEEERRRAALLLEIHFGETAKNSIAGAEAAKPADIPVDTIIARETVVDHSQLRRTCWDLVSEMQACMEKGENLPKDLKVGGDRLRNALLSEQSQVAPMTARETYSEFEPGLAEGRGSLTNTQVTTLMGDPASPPVSQFSRRHTLASGDDAAGELPDDLEAVCEQFATRHDDEDDNWDPGMLTLTRSSRGTDIAFATDSSSREELQRAWHEDIEVGYSRHLGNQGGSLGFVKSEDELTSLSASRATFATNDDRASSHVLALESEDLTMQLHAARDALAQEVCTGAELRTQLAVAQLELTDYRLETERLLSHLQNLGESRSQSDRTGKAEDDEASPSPEAVGPLSLALGPLSLADRISKITMEDSAASKTLTSQTSKASRTSDASCATRFEDDADVGNVGSTSFATLTPTGYSSNGTMPPWSEPFSAAWQRLATVRSSLSPESEPGSSCAVIPEVPTSSGDAAAGAAPSVSSEATDVKTTSQEPSAPTSSETPPVLENLEASIDKSETSQQSPGCTTTRVRTSSEMVHQVDPPAISAELMADVMRRKTEPGPRTVPLISQAQADISNASASSNARHTINISGQVLLYSPRSPTVMMRASGSTSPPVAASLTVPAGQKRLIGNQPGNSTTGSIALPVSPEASRQVEAALTSAVPALPEGSPPNVVYTPRITGIGSPPASGMQTAYSLSPQQPAGGSATYVVPKSAISPPIGARNISEASPSTAFKSLHSPMTASPCAPMPASPITTAIGTTRLRQLNQTRPGRSYSPTDHPANVAASYLSPRSIGSPRMSSI